MLQIQLFFVSSLVYHCSSVTKKNCPVGANEEFKLDSLLVISFIYLKLQLSSILCRYLLSVSLFVSTGSPTGTAMGTSDLSAGRGPATGVRNPSQSSWREVL